MSDSERRAKRRQQQAIEIEVNQTKLRTSIAESKRLVDEADDMLRRHRKEREDDDAESAKGENSN